MKKILFLLIPIFVSMILVSCNQKNEELKPSIVPLPNSVHVENGEFIITQQTMLIYDDELENAENVVEYLNGYLSKSAGFKIKTDKSMKAGGSYIHLKYDPNILHEEGYSLVVDTEGITISSSSSQGIFYGVQTLLQLLPAQVYSQEKTDFTLSVPFIKVEDEPRFKWRGMHLDVGRHYFDVEFIKKYIDYIAMHKMNTFHWHLTEDQGWRIEIKKYPKLTEIGSIRKETMGDGKPVSGFYTQEEVKEIVEYASKRFVTVVPEIEMPGHSMAALAAYPEYSCTGGPFEVETIWGVHEDVYCAGKEETFKFMEDIVSEVVELFPGAYFHIGGDESPKARWEKCDDCQARIKNEGLKDEHELQSYFIQRMEKFLNSKGKKLIGWDEILEGGIAPEATVMSWRGVAGGIAAAKSEHYVVMSPNSHCYFDYYQGQPENEPVAIGGFLPLSRVYDYEPIPEELAPEQYKYILGAQANVWTEYMKTSEQVEYMLIPRISAIAEVCWTNKELKNINSFQQRMSKQFKRYEALGVNYAKSAFNVAITNSFNDSTKTLSVKLVAEVSNLDIYYTLDGTEPTMNSKKYTEPLKISENGVLKAVSYSGERKMSIVTEAKFKVHKAFGKKVTLSNPYTQKYSAGGNFALVNGLYGPLTYSKGWQGYQEVDLEAIIDLEESTEINSISSNFIQKMSSWVFMPVYVEYSFSNDGKEFSNTIRLKNDLSPRIGEVTIKQFFEKFENINARYIKIFAKNLEKCPEWHQGAGGKAWLFIDKITVD